MRQLTDIASKCRSEIHIYDHDFRGSLLNMDDKHITFDYIGYNNYKNLSIPLSGEYQLYNICTAIRACELLRKNGVPIFDMSIIKGLLNTKLEGRLEYVSQTPPIILDGAHNPEAAHSLTVSIKKLFPDKKIIIVIGVMDDKDIKGILKNLIQTAESIILTKPNYERAASPQKLREIITSLNKTGRRYRPAPVSDNRNY